MAATLDQSNSYPAFLVGTQKDPNLKRAVINPVAEQKGTPILLLLIFAATMVSRQSVRVFAKCERQQKADPPLPSHVEGCSARRRLKSRHWFPFPYQFRLFSPTYFAKLSKI